MPDQPNQTLPKEFIEKLNKITNKRVATKLIRRTGIVWEGAEIEIHGKLRQLSDAGKISIQDYIKTLLKNVTILT